MMYRIEFSNGEPPLTVDGELSVATTLRTKYGHDIAYGHPGDLSDGGNRTLFWRDETSAEGDDGARALGAVRRVTR